MTKTKQLILLEGAIAVYYVNVTKPINKTYKKHAKFFNVKRVVRTVSDVLL
jgi:hypothetical protein